MSKKQIAVVAVSLLVIVLGVFNIVSQSTGNKVAYPYYCDQCHAVYDVSEVKKDYPENWRIPPGAPSDSVVLCIRCDEGWAYPATTCSDCGTTYLMHRWRPSDCPTCNPAIGEAAAARDIDLAPKKLQ